MVKPKKRNYNGDYRYNARTHVLQRLLLAFGPRGLLLEGFFGEISEGLGFGVEGLGFGV